MKSTNLDPSGAKSNRATRGTSSTQVAGSKGSTWRDASTESVGQNWDMTVYGLEFIDHEDGTGELRVGGPGGGGPGPGGGSGGEPGGTGAASIPIYMLNNSGENLDQGAVVVVDDTMDKAVTTTTDDASTLIVGVLMEPIAADDIGPVLFNGYAPAVETIGAVARGDYLETSATAGAAQASSDRGAGTFGVVVAGADVAAFVADSAITEEDDSVTSLAINMPESVDDTDSAGRILFLALWRDPSVTSDPTITGWTRVGATSGFWYYTRVCTVGDTASATWTGASPAAAMVALLDPTVASVEDFDYDATSAAAEVTGLDDNPRYALAAVQGATALPAGWTALPSAAVAHDPGGVTDLALAGTVTNDPANTIDWTNPTNVNDGNESTYASFPSHAAGETFRLKLDLGSPGIVSEAWVRTAYPMTLEYSTDDVTYNALPGVNWAAPTTHNGFPTYRRVTWTGGDITARYWRLGRTAAGMGSGETISTWELTGTHDLDVEGMLVGKYIGRDSSIESPFAGADLAADGVFAFNLHVEPKPVAILYGPDLGGSVDAGDVAITDAGGFFTGTDVEAALQELGAAAGAALGWFIPEAYGAAGDGTTNDTTAVADAAAAYNAAGGGVLYFPNKYLITAGVTLTEPGIVLGGGRGSPSGAGTTSEIICASATAVIFTVQDHVQFRDLQIRSTAATPSAGALVALTTTTDIVSFHGCLFRGGWIGVDIQEGGAQNLQDCWFTGQMKYALKIRNNAGVDGGDHSISDCYFAAFDSRVADAAIRIESAGGTKITNCKINFLNSSGSFVNGIDVAPVGTSSILMVANTSIENVSGDGIHIDISGFGWDFVTVVGNQFGLYANSTGNAVQITCANLGEIDNVVIVGNAFRQTGGGSAAAISLTKVNNARIGSNVRDGFGSMLAQSGCTNIVEDASSGAPTTADYLVGTASGDLSAEIVVGTSPGGELGGTWASPTIDGTHSGSAHADFIAKAFIAAKGDLIGASANDTPAIVPVGTNGKVLTADSSAAAGVSWQTPSSASGQHILLADGHGTPFTFNDLLQMDDGSDFMWSDPE